MIRYPSLHSSLPCLSVIFPFYSSIHPCPVHLPKRGDNLKNGKAHLCMYCELTCTVWWRTSGSRHFHNCRASAGHEPSSVSLVSTRWGRPCHILLPDTETYTHLQTTDSVTQLLRDHIYRNYMVYEIYSLQLFITYVAILIHLIHYNQTIILFLVKFETFDKQRLQFPNKNNKLINK